MDYGVNDAIIGRFDFDINNVKFAHEVFTRHVRSDVIDRPALLDAGSFISATRARSPPQRASNVAEVHATITRKNGIPVVGGPTRRTGHRSPLQDLVISGQICS